MPLPPRYSLLPMAVVRMRELPQHLKWTYAVLYALAWMHDYQWSDETLEQLARTFTDLGDEINPRGIRQRLSDLKRYGLIERRQVGGRYRTCLKVRHDQTGDAPNVTPQRSGDALERHPINNSVVVEADSEKKKLDHQQQQINTKGGDVERNEELLADMGVVGGVRYRLATETWVTPDYLEAIREYKASEAAKGNKLGPGWVVKFVGEKRPAPEVEATEPDRYRYVEGKYKDYIKH